MKRSQLEHIYRKTLTEKSLKEYKKQNNYISRLYKKERNIFFNSLNSSVISDNRKFWKTVKHLFSNKGNHGNKIKLVEMKKLLTIIPKLQKKMSDPVEKAIKNLDFIQVFRLSKIKLAKAFLKISFVLIK